MDLHVLLDQACAEATTLIDGTTDNMLDLQTLCSEWTVRELLNHIVGVATMLAVAGEHRELTGEHAREIAQADNLGDDFKGAWRAVSKRETAAFQGSTALEDIIIFASLGAMPGHVVLSIAVFDLVTHSADFAHATNQPMPSDELLEAALGIGTQLLARHRDPTNFGPELPAAPGASAATRLLAFAGRHIR